MKVFSCFTGDCKEFLQVKNENGETSEESVYSLIEKHQGEYDLIDNVLANAKTKWLKYIGKKNTCGACVENTKEKLCSMGINVTNPSLTKEEVDLLLRQKHYGVVNSNDL